MPLTISDHSLERLRAAAPHVLVELACQLYSADEMAKPQATRLAGLSRVDFEAELTRRGLPWARVNFDQTYEQEFAELSAGRSAGAGRGG